MTRPGCAACFVISCDDTGMMTPHRLQFLLGQDPGRHPVTVLAVELYVLILRQPLLFVLHIRCSYGETWPNDCPRRRGAPESRASWARQASWVAHRAWKRRRLSGAHRAWEPLP